MPFCHNCGKEVQIEWRNCPHCSCGLSVSGQNEVLSAKNFEQKAPVVAETNSRDSLLKMYNDFQEESGRWVVENKLKVALIVLVLFGSLIAISILDEDEGIVVEYTVTNYNCSNVEVQFVDSNENVQTVKNLAEGETFNLEVSGFEPGDLVGVSGVNRGSGYCTIIVNMYSFMYVDIQDYDTAGQGEAVSVASTLV